MGNSFWENAPFSGYTYVEKHRVKQIELPVFVLLLWEVPEINDQTACRDCSHGNPQLTKGSRRDSSLDSDPLSLSTFGGVVFSVK